MQLVPFLAHEQRVGYMSHPGGLGKGAEEAGKAARNGVDEETESEGRTLPSVASLQRADYAMTS